MGNMRNSLATSTLKMVNYRIDTGINQKMPSTNILYWQSETPG